MSGSPSNPVNIPNSPGSPGRSQSEWARSISNARLASPITGAASSRRSSTQQGQATSGRSQDAVAQAPLAGSSGSYNARRGHSALSSALNASTGTTPPLGKTPNAETTSLRPSQSFLGQQDRRSDYGSFAPGSVQSRQGRPSEVAQYEDFDVIRRHLAGPKNPSPQRSTQISAVGSPARTASFQGGVTSGTDGLGEVPDLTDGFSSLKMQGGDITREIYRRTEAEEQARRGRVMRSKSIDIIRSPPAEDQQDIGTMRQPGGFRRNHIIRNTTSPIRADDQNTRTSRPVGVAPQPTFLTANFYEFLSIYGHFAGEEYESDDDDEGEVSRAEYDWESREAQQDYFGDAGQAISREQQPLLRRATTMRKRRDDPALKKGAGGTALILLKGFVGSGVLFLPRAFLNGGMIFSIAVLFAVATISYYCFLLLTSARSVLRGSYADMGEKVGGKWMRFLINFSLVISQVGFASAYIVFTSENLRAFILAVSDCKTAIDIKLMILMQLIIFMPLSLYRNLNNISIIVYIADLFIVLGLVYLYYADIATMAAHGIADIALFNRDSWTLFIGTAIFTFEGIGLLIPIQDGMKNPEQLPAVLGGVMVIISVIFISMGALSYMAFGSKTETVIILNLPQDNKFVNTVQFLYSLAILLSTPLQIFPAITIMEKSTLR